MRPLDIVLAMSVAAVWGIAFVANEFALQSFSPPQLTALRFVLAALPVFFLRRPKVSWPLMLALGTFLFIGQFMFLFFAYEAGMPPGLASVTTHTQALFTIVIAGVVLREIPGPRQIAGVVIAFAGLGLVAASVGGGLSYLGLGLSLAGAVSWAIGNTILKRLQGVDMLALMIWLSLIPPLPALALSIYMGDNPNLFDAVIEATWISIAATLYLGLVATAVAYAIWGRLLNTYAAVKVTPFALFAPCTGILASYLVFGERVGALRGGGMAMILVGIAVILFGRRPVPVI